MQAAGHFAQSYGEARSKFLTAAQAAGLNVQSHAHPLLGHDGEALAMDVARSGVAQAQALLLITSACHGVEGFCGSGVQNALLADAHFLADAQRAGVTVLFVHALNPFGFSHWRRTTHENVDLNRNWQDFSQPLPRNVAYDTIAPLVIPPEWPPSAQVQADLTAYATQHGAKALQAAVSGGQYHHPDGLFYGGQAPTWSQQTLRRVLQTHATLCRRLAWIDLHTGLGPNGHGERIFACRDDAAALARARAWWGADVTSIYDGSSSSALLTGLMWMAAYQECPQADYTGIAMEYGTVPLQETIDALRCGQWHQNHPEAPVADRAAARQRVRDAFYTDTDAWKQQIVEQGIDAAQQAVRGLMS
jgi:predicted deacylase